MAQIAFKGEVAATAVPFDGGVVVAVFEYFKHRTEDGEWVRSSAHVRHQVIARGQLGEAARDLEVGDRVVVVGEVRARTANERTYNEVAAHAIGRNIVPE